jgi:hypothetical protein
VPPHTIDRTSHVPKRRVRGEERHRRDTVRSGTSASRDAEGAGTLPTPDAFSRYARATASSVQTGRLVTAMPESTSRAPSRTTGTPTDYGYAEAIAREDEQCRRLDAAIAELVAAAAPLWHRGDGYGGHVMGSLHGAIRRAGLPVQEWGKWPEVRAQFARRKAQFVAALAQRDGYECEACGTSDDLQVDHKTPVALGGKNDLENLHFLCRTCNGAKGTMTWATFLADLMAGE